MDRLATPWDTAFKIVGIERLLVLLLLLEVGGKTNVGVSRLSHWGGHGIHEGVIDRVGRVGID